jgi:hypothetical protein
MSGKNHSTSPLPENMPAACVAVMENRWLAVVSTVSGHDGLGAATLIKAKRAFSHW